MVWGAGQDMDGILILFIQDLINRNPLEAIWSKGDFLCLIEILVGGNTCLVCRN